MSKINKAVNQEAFMYLQALVGKDTRLFDLYVMGRWLCAVLPSGVRLMVKNEGTYKPYTTMK